MAILGTSLKRKLATNIHLLASRLIGELNTSISMFRISTLNIDKDVKIVAISRWLVNHASKFSLNVCCMTTISADKRLNPADIKLKGKMKSSIISAKEEQKNIF